MSKSQNVLIRFIITAGMLWACHIRASDTGDKSLEDCFVKVVLVIEV